jgi:diguanylate cyclase (GGDEF)-like protein
MTARALVVDDVDANRKLLEARLTAEYFEVRTAGSAREALEICLSERGGEKTRMLEITASVGVAAREFAGDTPELILKRADQALYCAKRDGRNRVVADAA